MELKLYDTLTRAKRVFTPIDPARVRMYVCGPTVYDFAHIGNARPVIVFDVLFRLLRHLYGAEHVTYVRNVTDVDDKINARAAERGISIQELTKKTYDNFKQDVAALGCLPPTFEPRATEYVHRTDGKLDMITLIQRLIDNGCAYVADGHVLFDVKSMPDYGKLARRSLDEMIAGARVEVAPFKRDPMDFVLWKPSPPELPGWDSPWGRGRPGWHIECSAMSAALLGETFDIHGGGIDLVFPHHENEIAQSRCAFDSKVMANYWMHNGFLQVEGEKMAKSAGNFITIREILNRSLPALVAVDKMHAWQSYQQQWNGLATRLAMLMTHYRQPMNWTWQRFEESKDAIKKWLGALASAGIRFTNDNWPTYETNDAYKADERFMSLLADDLNTPAAIAHMHQLAVSHVSYPLMGCMRLLGLLPRNIAEFEDTLIFTRSDGAIDEHFRQKIESAIAARTAARAKKDFKESDRIRDELAAMGVVLKDTKEGTTWEIAR